MSEVVQFDDAWARRITERIRYTALGIRDGVDKLQMLVTEAQNGDAHTKLGYASWTAYLVDVFAEAPLRLEREHRREVSAWLAGEGMSNRAIASITATDERTVRRDLNSGAANAAPAAPASAAGAVSTSPEVVEPVGEVTGDVEPPNTPSPVTVNPATGEVVDAPTVTEHTVTEKTRTVVGLDGKTYEQKPKKAKPVLSGESLERYDAETTAKNIGHALITLEAMTAPEHRNRVITRWWPGGNEAVPPLERALFEPNAIRTIAEALMELADELEVQA